MRGGLRVSVVAALLCVLAACEKPAALSGDAGPAASDAGRPRDAGRDGATAKASPFPPIAGAAPGPAWLLSRSHGLLGIDAAGKRTPIAMLDARVLDVEVLADGQTIVVETKGLRRVVGKSAQKVHAFGERMAADVEEGASMLPGPGGAISIVGAKRIWLGGREGWKGGWKGSGRTTVTAVARDRTADLDAAGTPLVFGIDVDAELRVQNGDNWDPVPGVAAGLLVKNAVLAIAPCPAGGAYVLREDGLYRLPDRTSAAVRVASLESTKGTRLAVSTGGAVAVRDPSGKVTLVSPAGDVVSPEATVGEPFAVDDLGRVWSPGTAGEGVVTVLTGLGPLKIARTGDVADLVAISVTGSGPPPDKLGTEKPPKLGR